MHKIYTPHRFTLVEILVVVGIVAVLAGLVLPAVIGGIQKGRVTQAKSDLAAIMTALKGVEGTYGKMVKSPYEFGKSSALTATNNVITLGGKTSGNVYNAYNGLIAILTASKNGITTWNINARRIKFLDPKPSFDPTKSFDDAVNLPHLWVDPWGNPYKIFINVTGTDELAIPPLSGSSEKTLAARAAGYSLGPNGKDDNGCNVNLNTCIHPSEKSSAAKHKLHDDITSWE